MSIKTTFLIVRHGETDWNRETRMMGTSDIPLNDAGIRQARLAAETLRTYPLNLIVSSPLLRTRQTAEYIASYHPAIPSITLGTLKERAFGILEGLTYEEANARYPQIVLGTMWQYPRFRPSGGESILDVRRRATSAIRHLTTTYGGKSVAVVTHGAFIRNFLSVLLELPLSEVNAYGFANASLSIVRYSPETGGEIHALNMKPMPLS